MCGLAVHEFHSLCNQIKVHDLEVYRNSCFTMNSESELVKHRQEKKKRIDERLTGKHIQTLTCLQSISSENEQLRHRVSELEGYKLREDYYATLETQVQSLQNELSKCDSLHKLGKYTEQQINEIRIEHSKSLQDYREIMEKRYKHQVESFIALQQEENKEWKDEKEQMRKVEEELRASNKVLQAKLEAAEAMQSETNNIVDELEETMTSFEEIKATNGELQESKNDLEELCASLEEESTNLQEKIENITYEKKKLKKDMNKMVMKITKYIKKIRELEQFKNSVSRLEFENTWTKHLHDKTLIDLKSLQRKHQDVMNELQAVTQERSLLKTEVSTVRQEVTELRDELENSKHSFTEFLELKRQVNLLQEEKKYLSKKSNKYDVKLLRPDNTILKAEKSENARQLVPVRTFKTVKSIPL